MNGFFTKWWVLMSLLGTCLLAAPCSAVTTVLLNANFNDKTLNAQIGTGGPDLGEPVFINPSIEAIVQATPLATPSLHIRGMSDSVIGAVGFEFSDQTEIQEGELRIAYTVRSPATLSSFTVGVYGRGSFSNEFTKLFFSANGEIRSSNATGSPAAIGAYMPNQTLHVEYLFHMDARTYDLRINDVLLRDNWPQDIADVATGIGRIAFLSGRVENWIIDELAVTHTTPNTLLLDANFNDKPLNAQIGTGGPTVGEPVSLTAGLSAIVRAQSLESRYLQFSHAGGVARKAIFEFLDGDEVRIGEVRVAFSVRAPDVWDSFQVRVTESLPGNGRFGGIEFTSTGMLRTLDGLGGDTNFGTYEPDQALKFELVYQLAAGTYVIYVDGRLATNSLAHSVVDPDKGIGAVEFTMAATSGTRWAIDDLRVTHGPVLLDANFNDQALDEQIGTGGAAAGQPLSLDAALIAEVRNGLFPTPALALEQTTNLTASSALFELLDFREITQGELRISVRVLPPAVNDSFSVSFRERGSSAERFGGLNFLANGDIQTSDQNGLLVFATYSPGVEQQFEYRFHMDSRTYDIYVDRMLKVANRPWGSTTPGRGIGRIVIGATAGTVQTWAVDDVHAYQPIAPIFQNGFD